MNLDSDGGTPPGRNSRIELSGGRAPGGAPDERPREFDLLDDPGFTGQSAAIAASAPRFVFDPRRLLRQVLIAFRAR
jgi:hypothetical protein